MTVKEAVAHYGVSKSTIYRRIKSGQLKAKKVGRKWVIQIEKQEPEEEKIVMKVLNSEDAPFPDWVPQVERSQASSEYFRSNGIDLYDFSNFGQSEGWSVENVELFFGPKIIYDDENWLLNSEGIYGINFSCDMPNRPPFIELTDGWALRFDIESVSWKFKIWLGKKLVRETEWVDHDFTGAMMLDNDRILGEYGIWELDDGQCYKIQAFARPRMRRAYYYPDEKRIINGWSMQGIGESFVSDTITESKLYYIQWNFELYEFDSWLVSQGEEKPERTSGYEPNPPYPDESWYVYVNRVVEEKGVTIKHIAQIMQRSKEDIKEMLKGNYSPDEIGARQFAFALDLDKDWLMHFLLDRGYW